VPVIPASTLDFTELPGRSSADPVPGSLGSGYSMRVVRIPPGPRTPHLHPRSDEIVYVVEGHGMAWEDGIATPVGAGDVLVVPLGVPHATVAHAPSGLVLVCFFPAPDLRSNIVELAGPLRA
jgi:quercetin dioxygenase-like cupin family protein